MKLFTRNPLKYKYSDMLKEKGWRKLFHDNTN